MNTPVSPSRIEPTDTTSFIADLARLVGPRGLLQGTDMASFEVGARYGHGAALCVVRPASVDEVSAVVRLCAARGVQLVPQGANTGLVGASSPDASRQQVLLSLSRLRGEPVLDKGNRSVAVPAGVLLQELNEFLAPHGLWFPVDLGANPSMGGMVAANTGGTRLIRYGDVRHNLLSLDVVLFHPPGLRVTLGRALRKDNTGLDLKQLFVGGAGAGGVITAATLEVHKLPRQNATALVVPSDLSKVLPLLEALESDLGDYLSAFEGISGLAMQAAVDHVPSLRNPFAPDPVPPYAVLIELESTASKTYTQMDLQETLNLFLQDRYEDMVENAVIGNGHELWSLRHAISEGARALGKPIAFDVSVPRSRIMDFREAALQLVEHRYGHLLVVDFGHIADGGVHFNVIWPSDAPMAYDPVTVSALRDDIYELVVSQFGGSFSAEHGVGPFNLRYYQRYTSRQEMLMAEQVRRITDPGLLCGGVNLGAPSASTVAEC